MRAVSVPALVSSAQGAAELGWTARPAKESIVEMAESLIRHGIVRPGRPAGSGPARQGVS
ncbi:hypothetical protein [Dactylosporangium sp. NPDC000521]|uniref:hypothetical protein n=1 Tax=Dactylosporangium sp. NPDC000521 TaxID=3363975 RepID=UPI0036CDB0F2